MATYRSHRGRLVDMDALRVQHENTIAGGNMNANARGDTLGRNGEIVETVAQKARINHRKTTTVKRGSIKGDTSSEAKNIDVVEDPFKEDMPDKEATVSKPKPKRSKANTISKDKEIELDDGSIEISDGK